MSQASVAKLTSEVETYQAEDTKPREPVVETPEVSEETPKDEGKAKQQCQRPHPGEAGKLAPCPGGATKKRGEEEEASIRPPGSQGP